MFCFIWTYCPISLENYGSKLFHRSLKYFFSTFLQNIKNKKYNSGANIIWLKCNRADYERALITHLGFSDFLLWFSTQPPSSLAGLPAAAPPLSIFFLVFVSCLRAIFVVVCPPTFFLLLWYFPAPSWVFLLPIALLSTFRSHAML